MKILVIDKINWLNLANIIDPNIGSNWPKYKYFFGLGESGGGSNEAARPQVDRAHSMEIISLVNLPKNGYTLQSTDIFKV